MSVKFLSGAFIRDRCSDFAAQVALQRSAFINFHRGTAVMGPRAVIPGGKRPADDAHFSYIARASPSGPVVAKFGSTVPSNASRALPVVSAYMFVLDAETGQMATQLEGETVTEIRTSAASLAAAMELSQHVFGCSSKVEKIAVVGAGVQGMAHTRGALAMFPQAKSITVCSRRGPPAEHSPEALFGATAKNRVSFCQDSEQGCRDADVIFLCTNMNTPPVETLVPEGSKKVIVSVGSFAPTKSEISVGDCLRVGGIFVDDVTTCKAQCGSIVQALTQGGVDGTVIKEEKVRSIGELYAGERVPAAREMWSALYFSVGLGIQDAAVAEFLAKSP